MKVVIVGPDSEEQGGMATVIKNFKEQYRGDTQFFYVSSWVANQRLKQMLIAFKEIKNLKKTQQPNIYHFHVAEKGSFFRKALLAAAAGKNTNVIFHMHAAKFDEFYESSRPAIKKRITKLLNKANLVVALSNEWQHFYQKITVTPVIVVENAVEIPAAIDYAIDSKQVVTFGRIGERKGSYDIFELAKKLQQTNPEIDFTLYGDGEKDIQILQEKIEKNKLENIRFGGWVTEKETILKQSALHLLPSYHEGVPMAILETMSYGIPNISTPVGGIPQVIHDQENGFLVEPGDVDLMETRVKQFFADRSLRERFSKNAYATIKEKHSIEVFFNKWDSIYQQITEKSYKDW